MTLAVEISGIEAIGNFAELQATVERAMERDYGAEVLDYIRLVEARLNREIRAPSMEKLDAVTLASGAAQIPADFLEARRVTYSGRTLDFISPLELADLRSQNYAQVCHYSIIGNEIVVPPMSDGSLQLLYWKVIPALGNNTPTNWLLTSHPDIYFAGIMHEACADVKDDDTILWLQKFDGLLDELKAHLVGKSISGPMRMRTVQQPYGSRI